MARPVRITREMDARITYCPGLMEFMSELETAAEGEIIVVISSEPECRTEIPLSVQRSGNELVAVDNVVGGAVRFIVRKHIRHVS